MQQCSKCQGFGRYQVYRYGRVMSEYCDCEAGEAWLKELKKEFENRGIDTTDPHYPWNRHQTS